MKKKFSLFSISLIFVVYTAFSAVPYSNMVNPYSDIATINIGYGVKLTPAKFLTLTAKEYQQLTGHRLSFFKSLALKVAQGKAAKQMAKESGGGKSQLLAGVLCFFLGGLGIHRFYLGYTWQGIVQLLTFGGLGIWILIDFIRILTGDLKPKGGEYSK